MPSLKITFFSGLLLCLSFSTYAQCEQDGWCQFFDEWECGVGDYGCAEDPVLFHVYCTNCNENLDYHIVSTLNGTSIVPNTEIGATQKFYSSTDFVAGNNIIEHVVYYGADENANCSLTLTNTFFFDVPEHPDNVLTEIEVVPASCLGEADGTATFQINIEGLSFSLDLMNDWDGGPAFADTNEDGTQFTIYPLEPGVYTFNVDYIPCASPQYYTLTIPYDCEIFADIDGDFDIDTEDLISFLSSWGCLGEDCIGDFNNDNVVNGADLITFLSEFGLGIN